METFFPTSTPAMTQELQAKIADLEKRVAELNVTKTQLSAIISRMRSNVNDFEMQLKEFYRDGTIDEETACALAEPFDISLGEELEVCITVTYRGTAIVPLSMNPADIDWGSELSFSFDPYGSEIEFDLYEDDIEAEVM